MVTADGDSCDSWDSPPVSKLPHSAANLAQSTEPTKGAISRMIKVMIADEVLPMSTENGESSSSFSISGYWAASSAQFSSSTRVDLLK